MTTHTSAARQNTVNIGTEYFGFFYFWFTRPRGWVSEVL